MAKNMAAVTNGVVTNMLWCSDSEPETGTLVNPADRPVAIDDTYSGGKFYRGGVEILTPLEEALKKNAEYEAALSEIEVALGVNA
uniref:Uncharacterized protein n=1 Tax=Siphoviridae sp. ctVzN31 TaxID=2825534 RepID=A0A8S5NXW4_9CAUD|nr:MAG TPA: hypothetical protein [Siphoviridae sp. ctVzN31]